MKKLLFIFFYVTFFQFGAFAQEDVKAKHAAYFLCINTMEKEPHKAFGYCSDYLKKYPDDDKRLTDFVKGWLFAYEKISRYLESANDYLISDSDQSWSIYRTDLAKQIPIVKDVIGSYKVEISREFASTFEENLLAKAEAVYPNPKNIANDFFGGWRYLSNPNVNLPKGEPKWWSGDANSILHTDIVTTSAVLYYHDIWRKLRIDSKQKFGGFTLYSSELKYHSSIKKSTKYERSGKSFSNVYIANMDLIWGYMCGSLCGEGFTRNKVVVLNEKGEILEMFLDDRVNSTSWIS